jgi:predicted DNA-binding transcriptional regulator YafY
MPDLGSHARGERDASWLVLQRGLAIVRRLMRSPADKAELLRAVRESVDPEAYSDQPRAAERALKNDRAALRRLGIEIGFDRRAGVYRLASLGEAAWLDLGDDELAAMALLYNAFADAGQEAARVRSLLDRIRDLLPAERADAIQRQRAVLSIELRELDENPIPPRVMQVVQQAVAERRRLGFRYRPPATGEEGPRYHEVEPYGIVFRRGHYYLECFDLYSREGPYDRTTHEHHAEFRLQGMLDDDMLRVLPERLSPGRRPQRRYPVRYRLAPAALRHGISRHFADMQVERLPDGSAMVEATTDNEWEAVYTLLSYGENCVVLGGDAVLHLMRQRVAAMAKNYDLLAFEV